jgi:diguanylate cyclase (GGDEF)-like protein
MRWYEKLNVRLMVPILIVLLLSISSSLGWLFKRQETQVIDQARDETVLISQIVKSAIRNQMLRNVENTAQDTISLIQNRTKLTDISVISKEGTVRLSSDPAKIGQALDWAHPTCAVCHSSHVRPARPTILLDTESSKTLRSMNLIENEVPCHQCHGEDAKYLGVLLVDQDTGDNMTQLKQVQNSLVGAGSITLVAIFGLIIIIVQRLVQRPVDQLLEGIRRIRKQDFEAQIDTTVGGELGELAGAFNEMVVDTRGYVQEIKNKTAELSTLYSIVERVARSIDLNQLRTIILDIVMDSFSDISLGAIVLQTRDEGGIKVSFRNAGDSEAVCENFGNYSGQVQQLLEPEILKRWLAGEIKEVILIDQNNAILVPLQSEDKETGLLYARKLGGESFSDSEIQLLDALRAHVSVALENARLYSLAITDELTQLYTLRYFQHAVQEETAKYIRYGQKHALLMLDLDDFKRINDEHGHPAGDAVLKQIAKILIRCVRDVDIVSRYGGEEFAIILPETDEKAAWVVAERIRSETENESITIGDTTLKCTFSIGIACCPAHATSVRGLVETADSALYRAKGLGKNQVSSASPPSDEEPNSLYNV